MWGVATPLTLPGVTPMHYVSKKNKKAGLSRKDDRAMRPVYGCPEKFRESLTTPIATFPESFNRLLFRLSL